jgi:hypothetical protein
MALVLERPVGGQKQLVMAGMHIGGIGGLHEFIQ